MIPIMQSVIGSGEPGHPVGTCMRACLASLLEIKEEDIFPFEVLPDHEWFPPLYEWLWDQGFEYHGWGKPENINDPKYNKGIDGYIMVSGGSPRGFKKGHAVIYKDGKLVHDPHPSGDGVTFIEGFWMLERRKA